MRGRGRDRVRARARAGLRLNASSCVAMIPPIVAPLCVLLFVFVFFVCLLHFF